MEIVLETERLLLRRLTEDDAENLLHLESDPEVLRYVGRKPLANTEAYRQHIRSRFLPYNDRPEGFGCWAIIEKAGGEFLGGCSLKPALDAPYAAVMGYGADEVEVGYGLRRSSWGKGYATELVRALALRAFTVLRAACLVASVWVGKVASLRVLEKAGLQRIEGLFHVPEEDQPSVKYVLTRDLLAASVSCGERET
jgi:RimJ/RimL family protein N-acetyltransferase